MKDRGKVAAFALGGGRGLLDFNLSPDDRPDINLTPDYCGQPAGQGYGAKGTGWRGEGVLRQPR